jgi:hypothetical protein
MPIAKPTSKTGKATQARITRLARMRLTGRVGVGGTSAGG